MDIGAPADALRDISNANENAPMEQDENSEQPMKIDPAKLTVTRDQFDRITCMLVLHLRNEEEKVPEEDDWEGIKRSDLVDWCVHYNVWLL